MKRILSITAIAVLAFAFSAAAQPGCQMGGGPGHGQGCGMGQGMMGHGMGPGMHEGRMGNGMGPRMLLMHADELELTDAQKGDLEDMAVRFQTDAIDRRAELQKAKVQLRALMRSDNPSQNAVNVAIDKVASLEADMQKMRFGHMQAVKEVLTPEQIEKIKEFRKQRFEERGAMRGMRQGRGMHQGGMRGMDQD